MVALLLVIRLQIGLPFVLEIIVLFQFLIFLALPTRAQPGEQGGKRMRQLWEVADFVRSMRRRDAIW